MKSYTKLFYEKAKRFQDEREKLTKAHDATVQYLERFAGSQGYDDEMQKENDRFETAMKNLRDESRPGLTMALSGMTDAIGKRTVKAPTADQINLLNILTMKKKVTVEELTRIAETIKDNPVALSLLTEIAHDHGIPRSFESICPEMSSTTAMSIVQGMRDGLEDYLMYDTTKASRSAVRFHEEHYGGKVEGGLKKRKLFDDIDGFYSEMYGMDETTLDKFSEIVDE